MYFKALLLKKSHWPIKILLISTVHLSPHSTAAQNTLLSLAVCPSHMPVFGLHLVGAYWT